MLHKFRDMSYTLDLSNSISCVDIMEGLMTHSEVGVMLGRVTIKKYIGMCATSCSFVFLGDVWGLGEGKFGRKGT